jgi:hypothetical protein
VRIEDDGVLSAGRHHLAEDDGRHTSEREQTRLDATAVKGFKEEVGIPLQIGRICSDVGDGEKIAELANQFGPMSCCILLRGLGRSGLCRESSAETRPNEEQENCSPFQHGTNLHGTHPICGYRARQKK